MKDLFARIIENKGPLGRWASQAEGYFVFPKLEGPISNRMKFQGKEVITWSINDYLGMANLPEIKQVDADAALEHGAAYPMGARMMSGHTEYHEQLENELAEFKKTQVQIAGNIGLDIDITENIYLSTLVRANYSLTDMRNDELIDLLKQGGNHEDLFGERATLLLGFQFGVHYMFGGVWSRRR